MEGIHECGNLALEKEAISSIRVCDEICASLYLRTTLSQREEYKSTKTNNVGTRRGGVIVIIHENSDVLLVIPVTCY